MNKTFKNYLAAWAVLAVIFNVLAFVIPAPGRFSGSFWVGWVFIMLALAGQLACAYKAFKAENKERLFLNLPLITVSFAGLIASFVPGALCMVIPGIPYWVGIVLCVLILGFTAIAVIKANAAAELVSETEQKVKAKTACIRMLTVDAESLLSRAQSAEAKAACKKVFEAVRYSDPMSSEALTGIEEEISHKFAEFSETIKSGTPNESVTNELLALIGDRNRKCKALK